MRTPNQARAHAARGARDLQAQLKLVLKTIPSKSRPGGTTWSIRESNGRFFGRLDFEPELAALVQRCIADLHLSPLQFLCLAVSEKIAAKGRAA